MMRLMFLTWVSAGSACGLYDSVGVCLMCDRVSSLRHTVEMNADPRSDLSSRGLPTCCMKSMSAEHAGLAVTSGVGTQCTHFVAVSVRMQMCLLPAMVVVNGPAKSTRAWSRKSPTGILPHGDGRLSRLVWLQRSQDRT